jgi:protein TonB
MAEQSVRRSAEAAEKFALALAASLLLHFFLIYGLKIRVEPLAGPASRVIEARLAPPQDAMTAVSAAPQKQLEKAPEQENQAEPAIPESPPLKAAESAAAPEPEPKARLPDIEIPLIEDTNVYSAKEVDVHPLAMQPIQPLYPDEAAQANVSGSVVLVLLLDEGGAVQEISVEEADPPGVFDASALAAFRNARFSPAQRNGRVVKSRMRIKVMYELPEKRNPIDKAKQK